MTVSETPYVTSFGVKSVKHCTRFSISFFNLTCVFYKLDPFDRTLLYASAPSCQDDRGLLREPFMIAMNKRISKFQKGTVSAFLPDCSRGQARFPCLSPPFCWLHPVLVSLSGLHPWLLGDSPISLHSTLPYRSPVGQALGLHS